MVSIIISTSWDSNSESTDNPSSISISSEAFKLVTKWLAVATGGNWFTLASVPVADSNSESTDNPSSISISWQSEAFKLVTKWLDVSKSLVMVQDAGKDWMWPASSATDSQLNCSSPLSSLDCRLAEAFKFFSHLFTLQYQSSKDNSRYAQIFSYISTKKRLSSSVQCLR